jgi:hypothetical protein
MWVSVTPTRGAKLFMIRYCTSTFSPSELALCSRTLLQSARDALHRHSLVHFSRRRPFQKRKRRRTPFATSNKLPGDNPLVTPSSYTNFYVAFPAIAHIIFLIAAGSSESPFNQAGLNATREHLTTTTYDEQSAAQQP